MSTRIYDPEKVIFLLCRRFGLERESFTFLGERLNAKEDYLYDWEYDSDEKNGSVTLYEDGWVEIHFEDNTHEYSGWIEEYIDSEQAKVNSDYNPYPPLQVGTKVRIIGSEMPECMEGRYIECADYEVSLVEEIQPSPARYNLVYLDSRALVMFEYMVPYAFIDAELEVV